MIGLLSQFWKHLPRFPDHDLISCLGLSAFAWTISSGHFAWAGVLPGLPFCEALPFHYVQLAVLMWGWVCLSTFHVVFWFLPPVCFLLVSFHAQARLACLTCRGGSKSQDTSLTRSNFVICCWFLVSAQLFLCLSALG